MRPLLSLFAARNYRLYFAGQVTSLVGTWMTQTATMWLVYRLTQSVFLLGLVGFVSQAPMLLITPFAGVWVDRVDRLRLLLGTQVLAMIQSLVLAVFTLTGHATVPVLLALAFVQGVIGAFEMPARQVLIVRLADKPEHLPTIISLNSSLINLGRIIGPALAGFVIAAWGAGFCFLIDGLSYIAVIFALLALRLRPQTVARKSTSVWKDLNEGFSFVFAQRSILVFMGLSGSVSLFGLSVFVMLPAYTHDVFRGEGGTLGLLMASFSFGGILSAIYLAGRPRGANLGRMIFQGLVLSGSSLLLFAASTNLVIATLALVVTGLGCVLVVASSNTLLQNFLDERMRGRTMSIYGMVFQGCMPLGSLITGALAQAVGLRPVTVLNAIAFSFVAIALYCYLPRLQDEALAVQTKSAARAPDSAETNAAPQRDEAASTR